MTEASLSTFDDFLATPSVEGLRQAISDWCERNGLSNPDAGPHLASEQLDDLEIPRPLDDEFVDRITRLVPLVRQALGLPHFAIDDVVLSVGVHGNRTSVHSRPSSHPTGQRRIDFVLHLDAGPEPFTGGGIAVGGERVAPENNRIVFFPSDRHHEVEATRSDSARPSRYTVWGWVTEQDAARTLVGGDRRGGGRHRPVVPQLSEAGFEVRPTPKAVQDLLGSLLELRSARARFEKADTTYHLGPDNDFIDVQDLADDVLHALLPIHEAFAGVPLQPSAMYGLRIYRSGATLRMHRDRLKTHVISSVLQIAQDVDHPWPLEVDIGGVTHQIVLSPGQMLLYEGAACAHGRPEPMIGRSFVNVFAHYRPVDWPVADNA